MSTSRNPTMVTRRCLSNAVASLCAMDPDLDGIVARFGNPPLWARYPGFATLVRIILEQQVSLASAGKAYARLQATAGRVTPRRVLELGVAGMRNAGLTRQKSAYCRNFARHITDGKLNLREMAGQDESAIREALLGVSGIGPWTADIFMLMALRRPDVWPYGDLALAKASQRYE